MTPVGFEPTISVGERPQTYDLDRAATGTGTKVISTSKIKKFNRLYPQLITNINTKLEHFRAEIMQNT